MNIEVNDKVTEVPDELTVPQLLAHLKVRMPDMVSVQLNGNVLDRKDFPATIVRENDSVEFLYFMGGGSSDTKRRTAGFGR